MRYLERIADRVLENRGVHGPSKATFFGNSTGIFGNNFTIFGRKIMWRPQLKIVSGDFLLPIETKTKNTMGTVKGSVLISYDIPHSHKAVKDSMKNKGYLETWTYTGSSKTYILPNTTLWKPDTSSDTAMSDLKASCSAANVSIEKAVSVLGTEWVGYWRSIDHEPVIRWAFHSSARFDFIINA